MKRALALALMFGLFVVANAQSQLKPVKVGNKWGYADRRGKLVVPAQFDRALPFKDGFAQVGVRDPNAPAEATDELRFLWGIVNTGGEIVLTPSYNQIRDFSDGLAAVGVAQPFTPPKRRWLYSESLKWGFIDRKGQLVVPIQFGRVGDFSEGLAAVNPGDETDGLCMRHGKFGYIDKTGAMVVNPDYAMAMMFKNGKARVGRGLIEYVGRCLCCNPEFQGEWGYIDKSGKFTPDKE